MRCEGENDATFCRGCPSPGAWQRQGLGRQLLEHLIGELEKRGVLTLWLEVRASNTAAIALYESLGFNEATIRRNYYPTVDGREDAIIMALPISM